MPLNGVVHRGEPHATASHLGSPSRRRIPPWVWKTVGALFIINVVLLILASYSWAHLRRLSLPFGTGLPLTATLLPIINFLFLSHGLVLAFRHPSPTALRKLQAFRTNFYILIFIILDTIVTVLGAVQITNDGNIATCALGDQWQKMFSAHDKTRIKRIQDELQCCGFKSPRHMAWPWRPVDQCYNDTGRETPCVGPWRQQQKLSAGLFVVVGVVLGVMKFIGLIVVNRNNFSGEESHKDTTPTASEDQSSRRLIEEIHSETDETDDQTQTRTNGGLRLSTSQGLIDGVDERTGLLADGRSDPRSVPEGGNVWRD